MYALHYKIVNYSAPDMALTYAGESSITLTKYTGANNQKWLLNAAGLQGFAGYCKEMNGSAKVSAIGGMLGDNYIYLQPDSIPLLEGCSAHHDRQHPSFLKGRI